MPFLPKEWLQLPSGEQWDVSIRGRRLCFSKTAPISTEWETASSRRENESRLAGAVSFCLSQIAGMNSRHWTPNTEKWPSWKQAAFPIPCLEKGFVQVLFYLVWLLCCPFPMHLAFLPTPEMYLLQSFQTREILMHRSNGMEQKGPQSQCPHWQPAEQPPLDKLVCKKTAGFQG